MRLTSIAGRFPRDCAVIIPAYNAARFLGATLDSLRFQTLRAVETVVVDDGSQDETSHIADGYEGVRVIRQQNAGVAAARRASTGTRVARRRNIARRLAPPPDTLDSRTYVR